MKRRVVMEPLHVSGFESHVQPHAIVLAQRVEGVQGFDLHGREPRDAVALVESRLRGSIKFRS